MWLWRSGLLPQSAMPRIVRHTHRNAIRTVSIPDADTRIAVRGGTHTLTHINRNTSHSSRHTTIHTLAATIARITINRNATTRVGTTLVAIGDVAAATGDTPMAAIRLARYAAWRRRVRTAIVGARSHPTSRRSDTRLGRALHRRRRGATAFVELCGARAAPHCSPWDAARLHAQS